MPKTNGSPAASISWAGLGAHARVRDRPMVICGSSRCFLKSSLSPGPIPRAALEIQHRHVARDQARRRSPPAQLNARARPGKVECGQGRDATLSVVPMTEAKLAQPRLGMVRLVTIGQGTANERSGRRWPMSLVPGGA